MTNQEALKIGFMSKMAAYGIPEEVAEDLYKQAFAEEIMQYFKD